MKNLLKKTFTSKVRKIDPFGGDKIVAKHNPANPLRLVNKYAIVTGGSNGIGRETALLFAESGISGLTISDLDDKKGSLLAEEINEKAKNKIAVCIKTDVSDEESVKNLFKKHMQHHGKLNVLFNNAGVMLGSDNGPVDTDTSVWRKTMAINADSVFFCCKYGIPEVLKSGGGSVINVASIVATIGSATAQIAYTASKGAVLSMSLEMGIIYARSGIRVNAISPGPLYTDLLKDFLNTDEKLDRRLVHSPYGRFGHPKEIAQAVTFLASDESSLVNASNFIVDGGLTSAYITPL